MLPWSSFDITMMAWGKMACETNALILATVFVNKSWKFDNIFLESQAITRTNN